MSHLFTRGADPGCGRHISHMVLDLPIEAQRTVEIFLHVIPFLPPELTVQVVANGLLSAEWRFSSSGSGMQWEASTRKLVLSPREFDGGILRLTFFVDRPLSPREAGLSSDERRLGFALPKFSLQHSLTPWCFCLFPDSHHTRIRMGITADEYRIVQPRFGQAALPCVDRQLAETCAWPHRPLLSLPILRPN
jgi:hypothetical protein